ncbi:MAG: class I SAM-dependent methyltransferase [Patescibacteria group bacterium]
MHEQMKLFGQAMLDYSRGQTGEAFWVNNIQGERFAYPIERYLRSAAELDSLEQLVVEQAYGNILDVGCATGYYIPALMNKGKVIGIDIAEPMIQVARQRGLTNCVVQDVMTYAPDKLFDTITYFEYTFGFAGSWDGLIRAFKKTMNLLKPGGQILGIWENTDTPEQISQAYFEYKGVKTQPITWFNLNQAGITSFCQEIGECEVTILGQTDDEYAYKIVKSSRF